MSTQVFDQNATPLKLGTNLIEASAGTGKTYTLCTIVLRLILEHDVRIEQILAVTFTIPATAELRDKIRERLREELDRRRTNADAEAIRRLERALRDFDQAQIFTIHGFCQRMLTENAFESAMQFDAELAPDPQQLHLEICRDFWRRNFYDDPLLPRLAAWQEKSPGYFHEILNEFGNYPDLELQPQAGAELRKLREDAEELLSRIIETWKAERQIILNEISGGKYKKGCPLDPENLQQLIESFDGLRSGYRQCAPEDLEVTKSLSKTQIEEWLWKKTPHTPEHQLFHLCQQFCETTEQVFHRLANDFVAFARTELPVRKAKKNLLTYSDLLVRLRDALTQNGGENLAAAIGGKYRAALIDEFQDTDAVQWEIISRIFGGAEHYLYLIGDPKQAIYRFRGADIFTYFRAAETAKRHRLDKCHRASQLLLDGIAALFSQVERPFRVDEIKFEAVEAVEREDFRELIEKEKTSPLRLRFLETTDSAQEEIFEAVAADIARLKSSSAKLGNQPMSFRDVAVLVNSNKEAAELQDVLREHGIKSALKSETSVFSTAESEQLQRFLRAVLKPGRNETLNAALATDMYGYSGKDIVALESDEKTWNDLLEQLLQFRDAWESGCFITMFRRFLAENEVRKRLIALRDGERRLTNYMHLADLLHQAELNERLAPEGLYNWLQQKRNGSDQNEAHQLRLESDEDTVLISTIHKSKGLEYPIVFVPLAWKSFRKVKRTDKKPFYKDGRYVLNLQNSAPAEEEEAAEKMRLLYVAITRARNCAYLYFAPTRTLNNSPLGHLLELTADNLQERLVQIASHYSDAISTAIINPQETTGFQPTDGTNAAAAARLFTGKISNVAMVQSFTGLNTLEAPRAAVQVSAEAGGGIFELAAGRRTGDFFHAVLENLDFQMPEQIEQLVDQHLSRHSLNAAQFRGVICEQLRKLLQVPLKAEMRLEQVAMDARLSEVEFFYRIKHLTPAKLAAVFAGHGGPELTEFAQQIGRLKFCPVEGYMHGKIDLLFACGERFYLIDWKTHLLGRRVEDYAPDALHACMLRDNYHLQYHIYTLAADLFLEKRVPGYDYDTHFGGVFYVFLRGINGNGSGIFRARPQKSLISALRTELCLS